MGSHAAIPKERYMALKWPHLVVSIPKRFSRVLGVAYYRNSLWADASKVFSGRYMHP